MEIENIDILSLPSLKIPERKNLPRTGGIYFVLSKNGRVEYIGKARNFYKRWKSHSCCAELDRPKSSRIAWLEVLNQEKIDELERCLIKKLNPRCNTQFKIKTSRPKVSFICGRVTKETFKRRRESLGLTQTGLAKILGIASNTVSGYETGRQETPKFIELVFEALELRKIKELQSN